MTRRVTEIRVPTLENSTIGLLAFAPLGLGIGFRWLQLRKSIGLQERAKLLPGDGAWNHLVVGDKWPKSGKRSICFL